MPSSASQETSRGRRQASCTSPPTARRPAPRGRPPQRRLADVSDRSSTPLAATPRRRPRCRRPLGRRPRDVSSMPSGTSRATSRRRSSGRRTPRRRPPDIAAMPLDTSKETSRCRSPGRRMGRGDLADVSPMPSTPTPRPAEVSARGSTTARRRPASRSRGPHRAGGGGIWRDELGIVPDGLARRRPHGSQSSAPQVRSLCSLRLDYAAQLPYIDPRPVGADVRRLTRPDRRSYLPARRTPLEAPR
jgi:hypothetical protein